MNFRVAIFSLLFCVFYQGQSQSVISGKISNSGGEPLIGATVTISRDSTASILAYGISDVDGRFDINVSSDLKNIYVKISFLGYATWRRKIGNKDQELEVLLEESSEELKEVLVESRMIEQRGDTLSYSVMAFKDQKDRVIADVIKKMPGIEIYPGGQIYYQGAPIQKYYIEGLDLLEGRYSLANNNISADDVSKVQILENHQPIKLLDSLVPSDRASLNIKLKNDISLSGTAELGAGFSPFLWKAKVTPMIFTKNQQAIVTYQSNNTGTDVSREIRDFSTDLNNQEFSINKNDWLSLRKLAEPPFSEERWLDNNAHLGSVNYLVKLKKDVVLKTNVSYLNDVQQQVGSTQTTIFTPADTIDIIENTGNELFRKFLHSKFTLERNTKENYLKNELDINGYWNSQRGNIIRENSQIGQELTNPFSAIQNTLKLVKPIGKQLVSFNSNTGYTEANQSLKVAPGQFEDILNDGEAFSEIEQAVEYSTLFTDNSAGITKEIKGVTVTPKIGFSLRSQNLRSGISISDGEGEEHLRGNYTNDLDFISTAIYFKNQFIYEKEYWSIKLATPVHYRTFQMEGLHFSGPGGISRFTFEPELFVEKEISAFWESSISANLSNDFGDIENLYYGYILNNYRTLQRYDSPLPENLTQSYRWRLSYRNPLNAIFAGISYSFGNTRNNLLYSSQINANGTTLFEAIEKNNYLNSNNFSIRGSKYFSRFNTTLTLKTGLSLMERDQLLNGNLAKVSNQNLSFNIDLESEITSWLSTSYNGNLGYLQTEIENKKYEMIRTQQHSLDLFFYLSSNQHFSLDSEYYYNSISIENDHNYFLNFSYQYTFERPKIDLEFSWNNILNTEEFVQVSNNNFSYIQNTYRLRPSQFLVSLSFSL